MPRPRKPAVPRPAEATERQQLATRLGAGDAAFEELRLALGLTPRALEEHLRHVARSARAAGHRLHVTPAECEDCGFVFRDREARHFHAPGRCPRCRSGRIREPLFRLE